MDKRRQDDLDGDEKDAVMGSYHTSDEDDSSDDGTDVDEYAKYTTDLRKYQYEQRRWNRMNHSRKYKRDPRHKEERRMKAKARKEEKARMILLSPGLHSHPAYPDPRLASSQRCRIGAHELSGHQGYSVDGFWVKVSG